MADQNSNLPAEFVKEADEAFKDLTEDQIQFIAQYQQNITALCERLAKSVIGPEADWTQGAQALSEVSQSMVDLVAQKTRGMVDMIGLITLMAMTIGNQLGIDVVRKREANPGFKVNPGFAEEAGMLFEAGVRAATFSTEQTMSGKLVFGSKPGALIQ